MLLKYFSTPQALEAYVLREMLHVLHDSAFEKHCLHQWHQHNKTRCNSDDYALRQKNFSYFREQQAVLVQQAAREAYEAQAPPVGLTKPEVPILSAIKLFTHTHLPKLFWAIAITLGLALSSGKE